MAGRVGGWEEDNAMADFKSSLDPGQYLTNYCLRPHSTESYDLHIIYYQEDFRKKKKLT